MPVSNFRLERMAERIQDISFDEPKDIERIKYPIDYDESNRAVNLESLAWDTALRGFNAYYIEQDTPATKQWFYLAARLLAKSCEYSGGWDMRTPHKFIFALLSDNQNIIEDYKELNTKNNNGYPPLQDCYEKPREGRFNVLLLQHLLRRDWPTIEKMWATYQEKMKKPDQNDLDEFQFYFALRDGDKATMQDIITRYLAPRKHKSFNKHLTMEFSGEFWSHRPTMYSKLAAMFGYELDIEHELIPKALIPVRPLEHYDDYYEFFAPDFDWETGLIKPRSFLDILLGRNKRPQNQSET